MDAALRLAIIYPLVFLLLQWALTNAPTGIADLRPLQPAEPLVRAAMIGVMALLLTSAILRSMRLQGVFEKLADVWWLLALALISAGSIAGAGASAGAVAIVLAVAFAGAGAFTLLVAGAFAFAFPGMGVLPFALVVAGAHAVGWAVARGDAVIGYGGFIVGGLGLMVASLIAASGEAHLQLLIVFAAGILPLVNAIFDYLSYGVTLGLLRLGRAENRWPIWVCGLMDAFVALVLLYLLSLSLALLVAGINAASAVPLLPLDRLFDDLAAPETRGAYAWLYLTLLSTLVPTGIHLLLVLTSIATWIPRSIKRKLVNMIEDKESNDATIPAILAFSFSITAVPFLFAFVIWTWGDAFLDGFDDAAMLLLAAVRGTLEWVGIL